MKARFRKLLNQTREEFWPIPGLMVLIGVALALGLLRIDRSDLVASWLIDNTWLYNGGGTGARTLLGAIAASTIGVASTVFSITIAALSLAAGQMGPRLLRNFTRDRGVQITLGVFLGTFSYALMVLRSVRTHDEGGFTPHVALTAGIALALICVATLVYFVGHMATRINVDTVVELVSGDIHSAIDGLLLDEPQRAPPPVDFWKQAVPVVDGRRGYLQQLDEDGLGDWARSHGTAIRLLIRRGDYVFPGAPIAVMTPQVPEAELAIHNATALGTSRGSSADAEYAVRQLVEVAVRALSPGINDPHTAISVLNRLGATLCDLAGRHLPSGVHAHNDIVALVVPSISYASLVRVMFHLVRQNASGSPVIMIRLLEVLAAVLSCEKDAKRRQVLLHHAELVWHDSQRTVHNRDDLMDIQRRYSIVQSIAQEDVRALPG